MTNPSWAIFDPDYSAIYDLTTRHRDVEAEVDALARLAGGFCASSAGRILDIGCGTGRHARRLAERGFDSFGVDPSAAMIRRALMPKTGAKFFCCTMEEFLEKDFHFAYSMGHVVNYLQTEEGLISFFRGVCRALGKG
ncbi:methyltransferase domain-containing protein, partial [bacterium]